MQQLEQGKDRGILQQLGSQHDASHQRSSVEAEARAQRRNSATARLASIVAIPLLAGCSPQHDYTLPTPQAGAGMAAAVSGGADGLASAGRANATSGEAGGGGTTTANGGHAGSSNSSAAANAGTTFAEQVPVLGPDGTTIAGTTAIGIGGSPTGGVDSGGTSAVLSASGGISLGGSGQAGAVNFGGVSGSFASSGGSTTTGGSAATSGTSGSAGSAAGSGGGGAAGVSGATGGLAGGSSSTSQGGQGSTGVAGAAGTHSDEPPSCKNLKTACGGESCCKTIRLAAGVEFKMGRSVVSGERDYYSGLTATSDDELPEHNAVVASFSLDKYEVTVGRFRQFVDSYDDWIQANPVAGQGANPNVGSGIVVSTGWVDGWKEQLPQDADTLKARLNWDLELATWSDDKEAGHEAFPINFVDWYLAFAFCIWDKARLPTEAEWEYAAAGGAENRLFPWASEDGEVLPANYSGHGTSPRIEVGSYTAGAAAFGHEDLAGSLWEWMFDWYAAGFYSSTQDCVNCAGLDATSTYRSTRGGSYSSSVRYLRSASRDSSPPTAADATRGFRCAR